MKSDRGLFCRRCVLSLLMFNLSLVANAASPLWDLRPGDSFVVDLMTVRVTSIVVDESEPMRARTTERLELEYRVESVTTAGILSMRIRIRRALRAADPDQPQLSLLADQRLNLLENVELMMEVAPDGLVERLTAGDRTAMINSFTGLNSTTTVLLEECCSDETVRAWFARPLWFFKRFKDLRSDESWDRADVISLGALGSLKANVRIQPSEVPANQNAGENRLLTLTGSGRFSPSPLLRQSAESDVSSPIQFLSADAVLDEYSGSALLSSSAPPDSRGLVRRPLFESLELNLRLHGSCRAEIGDTERLIEFRQQQMQTWSLRSWRMGSPFLSEPGGITIVPQPVPDPEP